MPDAFSPCNFCVITSTLLLLMSVPMTSGQNLESSSTEEPSLMHLPVNEDNLPGNVTSGNATAVDETFDECKEADSLPERFSGELAKCISDVIREVAVTSFAVVSQCPDDQAVSDILRLTADSGVSVCVFTSLAELTRNAMSQPDNAHCFANRDWTVVLVGTPVWAASLVTSAKRAGLYDAKVFCPQRVYWLIAATEEDSIHQTLPMFSIYHRLTWIKLSSRDKYWLVLASEATSHGVAARQVGQWKRQGREIQLQSSRSLKPPYTTNFFQRKLRVISRRDTDETEVFNAIGRCFYTPEGKTTCSGYVGELLMILARSLNLQVINNQVLSCGTSNSIGTRVSYIAKDEADIALGTCSITYDRVQVVDFTQFFHVISSNLMSAFPNVASSPFMIFKVLNAEAWVCVGAFVMLAACSLWTTMRVLPRAEVGLSWSLAMAFVLISKALLLQAHSRQPRGMSSRAVAASSWLVIITLVAVYSGNLTAWLSLPRYERPINSLDDLLDRPDLIPVVSQNDPNHLMFANMTEGTLGAIARRLNFRSGATIEMTKKIVQGEIVYMNSIRSHLDKATDLNKYDGIEGFAPCRIHIGTQDIRQDYLGLMINKNSWFKEQMNRKLQWVRSYGIVNKLYSQYNPPGCRLDKPGRRVSGTKKRLNLAQLQGIFWVWLTGMALAFAVLLAEMASSVSR